MHFHRLWIGNSCVFLFGAKFALVVSVFLPQHFSFTCMLFVARLLSYAWLFVIFYAPAKISFYSTITWYFRRNRTIALKLHPQNYTKSKSSFPTISTFYVYICIFQCSNEFLLLFHIKKKQTKNMHKRSLLRWRAWVDSNEYKFVPPP